MRPHAYTHVSFNVGRLCDIISDVTTLNGNAVVKASLQPTPPVDREQSPDVQTLFSNYNSLRSDSLLI